VFEKQFKEDADVRRAARAKFVLRFALPLAVATALLWAFDFKSVIALAVIGVIALYGVFVLRGGSQYAAIILATAGIALAMIECVAVVITPRILITPSGFYVHDAELGYTLGKPGRYRARRTLIGTPGYDVVYTINSQSMRQVEAGATGKGVAFFGDSFIFGYGLNDADTLPQIFANLTDGRFPVFDAGVPGWSPANVLAEIQSGKADKVLRNSAIAVQFIAPWHAERMACNSGQTVYGPRYQAVKGGVERLGRCPTAKKSIFSAFSIYNTMIAPHLRRLEKQDIANIIAVMCETVKLTREEYHVPTIIYYLRDPDYLTRLSLSWTDDQIMDALRTSGAQVLDYTLADGNNPKYLIEGDGHPSALANRLRAARLINFMQAQDDPPLNISSALNPASAGSL
jgi:hypothetical protein